MSFARRQAEQKSTFSYWKKIFCRRLPNASWRSFATCFASAERLRWKSPSACCKRAGNGGWLRECMRSSFRGAAQRGWRFFCAQRAATINAACALRREKQVGSLEVGKQADVAVFEVADYREIPYYFGVNHCWMTIKRGRVIHAAKDSKS